MSAITLPRLHLAPPDLAAARTPLPVLSCDGCGVCCDTQGTPPFSREEGDCPPPELEWDVMAHARRYDEGLPCLWYDAVAKRCRHYEVRPEVCRMFSVGGEDCLRMRAERNTTGKLFTG